MRYINIIIYLLLFTVTKSQNLVPNPSFETYTSCPTNYGQINSASGWDYIQAAQSAEYFNACSTSSNVSVPKNFSGTNYQLPRTGNAYAGVTTFYYNLRDNIYTQLNSTLTLNNYYLVKMYAACVQSYKLASNNLALSFSNVSSYTLAPNTTLNLPMHIYKYGNPVLKDTLNWTEIMGIYKAIGNEQYIIIGNFKDSLNTKVDTINSSAFSYASSYLIDDVSVEPICVPFWSYRDTTVMVGDSVLIGPAITGLNINWYDSNNNFIANAPAIYVKPNSPTYYTASEDFCNGITTHTINVTVIPTSVKEYNTFTNSISLFPNPATNNFTISYLTESSKLKVDITDTQGKLYSTELITISNNKATIKTNLTTGIYFVSITDTVSGLKIIKKLIVQK
jgi:hypothetical protein